MDDVQRAFRAWQDTFPDKHLIEKRQVEVRNKVGLKRIITEPDHWDGDCCRNSHFDKDSIGSLIPKTDDMVCARERAWRNYVSVRDGALVN